MGRLSPELPTLACHLGRPDGRQRAVGENGRVDARMIRGGVIAAIVLVVLGAAGATPWVVTLRLPTFDRADPLPPVIPPMTLEPQQPEPQDPAFGRMAQQVLVTVLIILAAAVAAYLLYRLIQRLRGAWRPDTEAVATDQLNPGDVLGEVAEVDIEALATAVARAEARLAGLAEPRDAVTAAWVALEDEAARQGTVREPAQTATEFTTELLRHSPTPADAVADLRSLYQKARFTTHPVTGSDVERARAALARIAGALDATALDSAAATPEPAAEP